MNSSSPATKEDIDEIYRRLLATDQALGIILLSLSRRTHLDPVFDDAEAIALALGEEKARGVYEIIYSIRYAVKEAITARVAAK